jgi:NCS2 family nucleobase:cation symporter-2
MASRVEDGFLGRFLGRILDRRVTRPQALVYGLDDVPTRSATLGLALQHVAIQSVNFVIPAVLAGSLSPDPTDAGRFLSLSILAAALWQALQLLTRGPIGSGYPIPATHTASLVGAYAITGLAGFSFGAAGAMLILTGIACVMLTFVMHRLRLVLPNEVSGVVIILIGVALVMLATQRMGMQPGGRLPTTSAVFVLFGSLLVMVAIALTRTRIAPFAVLIGMVAGTPLAIALGHGYPDAAPQLAASAWIAVPQPWLPRFDEVSPVPLLAFLVAIVALKASAVGNIVVLQRASDAGWTRPDAPPIRRGLLANGVAIIAAGATGGACPGPATAGVGLSIVTGTLARRIVWAGSAILLAAAMCPKLAMLFVLMPEPIKAATLFYTAGFIMAHGATLVTSRLLDTRRMLIVAFGLSSGIAVAVAPQAFVASVPVLASPLAIGALVAFLMNVCTLPMVSRRTQLEVPLDSDAPTKLGDWMRELAGSWALKPQTEIAAEQALFEFADLFMERGVAALTVGARLAEDRIEITLTWSGAPLPERPKMAIASDLMGDDLARERFSVWLATRQAQGFRQRQVGGGNEVWLAFED